MAVEKKLSDFIVEQGPPCQDSLDEFLKLAETEAEMRDLMEYFIQYRELLRDEALEQLEKESTKLIEKLRDTKTSSLLEELQCFKDILSVQKMALAQEW